MPDIRPILPLALLLLPGCVAKTAVKVATLPVKATGKAIDWSTTSQEEADRNRGRELRKYCEKHDDPARCSQQQQDARR